jgi:hypothetical protein
MAALFAFVHNFKIHVYVKSFSAVKHSGFYVILTVLYRNCRIYFPLYKSLLNFN